MHEFGLKNTGRVGEQQRSGVRKRSEIQKQLRKLLHEPKRLLLNVAYLPRELRLLRACRPDVVLARDDLLTVSFVLSARRLGLPLVIEKNGPVLEFRLYGHYRHLPYLPESWEGWKLRQADRVTAVSSALRGYLADTHRLPDSKFSIVPNGADPEVFHPEVRSDSRLPHELLENPVVGFVGSFKSWHGPDLLARMAVELGTARPSCHFLFVGDGSKLEEVKRRTESLGPRIHFTGNVPHERVPGLVAAFDIAVMPESNFYGSPLKVIEWMAAGKAVVAPRYGPLEELIQDGVEGMLFAPGDLDSLVRALLTLYDQPDLRCSLGRAAISRVRASLTWRHNAERMVSACGLALSRWRGEKSQG